MVVVVSLMSEVVSGRESKRILEKMKALQKMDVVENDELLPNLLSMIRERDWVSWDEQFPEMRVVTPESVACPGKCFGGFLEQKKVESSAFLC
jgi:hypothetical protein